MLKTGLRRVQEGQSRIMKSAIEKQQIRNIFCRGDPGAGPPVCCGLWAVRPGRLAKARRRARFNILSIRRGDFTAFLAVL